MLQVTTVPNWWRPSMSTSRITIIILKPFIWTNRARDILQKVICANSRLNLEQNATLHSKLPA
jgi:hypothetical protein